MSWQLTGPARAQRIVQRALKAETDARPWPDEFELGPSWAFVRPLEWTRRITFESILHVRVIRGDRVWGVRGVQMHSDSGLQIMLERLPGR